MNAHTFPVDTRINRADLEAVPVESPERRYTALYRTGGLAAVLASILIPIQIIVFVVWPPPAYQGAAPWFELFQRNALLGLLSLDLLLMIDYLLLVPVMLAIHCAIRRSGESMLLVGTTLFMISVAVYFASNTSFEMLALSRLYAEATTVPGRELYLAVGEGMLSTYQGTAFHVSYIVGSIAGMIIGLVMLRSRVFNRAGAWLMFLGNLVGLGLYLPGIGVAVSAFSGVMLWGWTLLMALQLLKLARGTGPDPIHIQQRP
jgi:hypothetical protein